MGDMLNPAVFRRKLEENLVEINWFLEQLYKVERFEVELKPGSSNQCIEAGSDALVTIQDDDPKPKPSPLGT